MRSEPRRWYDQRTGFQMGKYKELQWGTPRMVSQVDGLRSDEGRLPSQLTQDTTRLAADIVRSKPPLPTAPAPADTGGAGLAEDEKRSPGRFARLAASRFLRGLSEFDRPISERAGIEVPEMRGPVDEIGNLLLEEATRPTTYATAAFGGPVSRFLLKGAAKASLPAVRGLGKVAGSLVEPISRSPSAAQRVGKEAAFIAAARGGSEEAVEALPEGTSPWIKAPVALGAGLGTGVGVLQAGKAVARGVRGGRGSDPLSVREPRQLSEIALEQEALRRPRSVAEREFDRLRQSGGARAARLTQPEAMDVPGFTPGEKFRKRYGGEEVLSEPYDNPFHRFTSEGRFRARDPQEEIIEVETNRTKRVGDSLANTESNQFRVLQKRAFPRMDSQERLPYLVGTPGWNESFAPTFRDVAARLPIFQARLSPEQLDVINFAAGRVDEAAEAYWEAAELNAALLGKAPPARPSRPDVMPTGHYLPRGIADEIVLPDGDLSLIDKFMEFPKKLKGESKASARRKGESLAGYEKAAKFDSEGQGIDLGWAYQTSEDSLGSYLRSISRKTADLNRANFYLQAVDEQGNRLARNKWDRIAAAGNLPLVQATRALMRRIAGKKGTLKRQYNRQATLNQHANQAENIAIRAMQLREQAAERLEGLQAKVDPKELQAEARSLLKDSISAAKKLYADYERARARTSKKQKTLRKENKELDALLEELEAAYKGADLFSRHQTAYNKAMQHVNKIERSIKRVANGIAKHEDPDGFEFTHFEESANTLEFLGEMRALANSDVLASIREMEVAGTVAARMAAMESQLKVLSREADRKEAYAEKVTGKRTKARSAQAGLRRELDEMEAELSGYRQPYNRAIEAAQLPGKDEDFIDMPTLGGWSWPKALANAANIDIQKQYRATGGGAGANIVQGANDLNQFLRSAQSTGELSVAGIQLLPLAGARPGKAGRAFEAGVRAWGNAGEDVLGSFILDTNAQAAQRGIGLPTVEELARDGLHIGGVSHEFRLGGRNFPRSMQAFFDLPGVRTPAKAVSSVVKRADLGYGTAGDVGRIGAALAEAEFEMMKRNQTWNQLPVSVRESITESANRITGWTPQRAFGSVGEVINFAPRYLLARARALGQLVSTDPLKRAQANRLMAKFIGNAIWMTVAVNLANGEETDFRPFSGKNGPTFNPNDAEYKNPNFLRIMNVAGRDWSLLGPIDSLAGLGIGLGSLITNPTGKPSEWTDRTRQMLSAPILSSSIDWMVNKEDFEGNPLKLNSRAGQMDLLQRTVPFALPELFESGQTAYRAAEMGDPAAAAQELAGGVVQAGLGGRGTRQTIGERVERDQTALFSGEERFRSIKPEAWKALIELPDFSANNLDEFRSIYQWRRNREEALTKYFEETPLPDGTKRIKTEIRKDVDRVINLMPVNKAYIAIRNSFMDQWIIANPEEALRQANIAEKERSDDPYAWNPTKAQSAFLQLYASYREREKAAR